MIHELEFREWMLDEGERWDALTHAVKTGFKAYKKKRDKQRKEGKKKEMLSKLMSSDEGSDEENHAVDDIVKNGYTVSSNGLEHRNGKKPSPHRDMRKWMTENAKNRRFEHRDPRRHGDKCQNGLCLDGP